MGTPEDFKGVYDLIAAGKVRPVVDRVFPLAEARAAHERLEAGEQLGKIVLSIPAPRTESAPAGGRGTRGSVRGVLLRA